MAKELDQEMLTKYGITEDILKQYMAKYNNTIEHFLCMTISMQMCWCEEAAYWNMEQIEMERRNNRIRN